MQQNSPITGWHLLVHSYLAGSIVWDTDWPDHAVRSMVPRDLGLEPNKDLIQIYKDQY